MSRVIFSEGENDTEFLECIINGYHSVWTVNRLDIESQPSDDRWDRETVEIDLHQKSWRSEDVLVKSEGGRPNLLDVMPTLIRKCSKERIRFDFLIDLDRDSMDYFVEKVNDTLNGTSAGHSAHIQSIEGSVRTGPLILEEFEFVQDGSVVDDFYIIAFDPDLEEVAGISDTDSNEEIESKIANLAQDKSVRAPITRALFADS